jgi:hypothetical protein
MKEEEWSFTILFQKNIHYLKHMYQDCAFFSTFKLALAAAIACILNVKIICWIIYIYIYIYMQENNLKITSTNMKPSKPLMCLS